MQGRSPPVVGTHFCQTWLPQWWHATTTGGDTLPGNAPTASSEREALLVYLQQQRDGLRNAGFGLTPDQLRAAPTVSSLSVGGLIKHAASTERSWAAVITGRPGQTEDAYLDSFTLGPAETLVSLTADLRAAAAATEAALDGVEDLGDEVTLPVAPWMPTGGGYSVRWVLLHIFEELARHAGHADIIREHLDGATMYPLMAAAEGWPETDWLKPWRPPTG